MNEPEIRNQLFAVFLSANKVERIEFAKQLLPPGYYGLGPRDITIEEYDDVILAFQSYCYNGDIGRIIAFLRDYYIKLPESTALTSGDPEQARQAMKIRIENIKNPKGGRRRKTKKSKRRSRKTRRRHK